MKCWLSRHQYVRCRLHTVTYCEITYNKVYTVTLNRHQFDQLHDVILHDIQSDEIPLGGRAWLLEGDTLHIDGQSYEFTFTEPAWLVYIRRVHPRIHSFLHHDGTHHQRDERLGLRRRNRSRRPPSPFQRQRLSSWPTTDVSGDYEQWTERTTLSERQTPDSRQPFSFRRTMDGLRDDSSPTTHLSAPTSQDPDFEEFGSVCTLEEPHSAP